MSSKNSNIKNCISQTLSYIKENFKYFNELKIVNNNVIFNFFNIDRKGDCEIRIVLILYSTQVIPLLKFNILKDDFEDIIESTLNLIESKKLNNERFQYFYSNIKQMKIDTLINIWNGYMHSRSERDLYKYSTLYKIDDPRVFELCTSSSKSLSTIIKMMDDHVNSFDEYIIYNEESKKFYGISNLFENSYFDWYEIMEWYWDIYRDNAIVLNKEK